MAVVGDLTFCFLCCVKFGCFGCLHIFNFCFIIVLVLDLRV